MSLRNNTSGLNTLKDLINALPEYIDTTGTAEAADIYSGKTATVGGVKLTGTNPYNAANVDPAVADAITALTDKGVDAAGAGLADLAGLIAGIESGGVCAWGTAILAEDSSKIYIPYDVLASEGSVFPKVAFICPIITTNKKDVTSDIGGCAIARFADNIPLGTGSSVDGDYMEYGRLGASFYTPYYKNTISVTTSSGMGTNRGNFNSVVVLYPAGTEYVYGCIW